MIGLSGAQMAADAEQIVATMGLHEDSPNLGVISLAHSYGFSNLVLPLLLHGIPLILLPSVFPAAVFQEATQWPDVSLPAVPALWQAWANGGKLPSSIRLAISAGAPLPVELERFLFERDGIKVHNFLGASECGGIAYDRTAEPRSDWTVAGTAMKGVQLHIADDGCLEVQSPAVAETYYPDSDDRLGGGIYRSSDLAEMDPSGQIRLLGRSTDLINVAGRKVGPETIEVQIRDHPAVADVLVFSVPEAGGRNEAIVAAVALKHPVSEMELRNFLGRSLPSWQLPRRWWFLEEIPADIRGKRSRKLWRERFLTTCG
jgi:acyl-coenzyme A synthetase/AMP-(fatty) acid ligase